MTGLNIYKIESAIFILQNNCLNYENKIKIVKDYDTDNFSEKITKIVISYIDSINKKVCKKHNF